MLHMAHFEKLKYHNVKYRKSNKELKFLWAIKSFQTKAFSLKGATVALNHLFFINSGIFPRLVKSLVSSRWSFGPNSVWGSKEVTTIGKTHPTLGIAYIDFITIFLWFYELS